MNKLNDYRGDDPKQDLQNLDLEILRICSAITANYNNLVPIGTVLPWHKSKTNTPALPGIWVECNGQTLDDPESDYHGQVIENLNGDATGADSPGQSSKEQMFLRGGTTSGTGQTDQLQGHFHTQALGGNLSTVANVAGGYVIGDANTSSTTGPISDGTNGTPRTGTETRPKNMSVVWIMRIK